MISYRYIIHGVTAYTLWGLLPLYWKLLANLPATIVVAHRVVWSAVFFLLIFLLQKNFKKISSIFSKSARIYYLAAILLSFNWGSYIWAVSNNYVVASSLGYFMAPLFYTVAGVIFASEKLKKYEIYSFIFGLLSVFILIFSADIISVLVALILALSMVFYGLLRRKGSLSNSEGLYVESLALAPIAIFYIFYQNDYAIFLESYSSSTIFYLVLAGPATLIPLLFFSSAVKNLKLSTVGYLQYISPVLQLLLGVLIFKEELVLTKIIAFIFVWLGIAILVFGKYFETKH